MGQESDNITFDIMSNMQGLRIDYINTNIEFSFDVCHYISYTHILYM